MRSSKRKYLHAQELYVNVQSTGYGDWGRAGFPFIGGWLAGWWCEASLVTQGIPQFFPSLFPTLVNRLGPGLGHYIASHADVLVQG